MANGLDEKRAVAFAHQVREMDQQRIRPARVLRARVRYSPRRRDGSGRRRAGGARLRDRQRAQLHESGSRGDDRPAAARAGVSAPARAGASHGPHSAASRSVSVRFRSWWPRKRRGAMCISKSTPAPSGWIFRRRLIRAAKAKGCKFVISTDAHHPKHLANMQLRRAHGAARLAGGGRYSEHALRRRIREGYSNKMKLISSKEITQQSNFHVTQDHALDPDGFEIKRAIVQHRGSAVMMPVDEKKPHSSGAAISSACPSISVGTAGGHASIPGEKPLQTARRELVEETGYRAKKWTEAGGVLSQPRISDRKDDHLSGHGLDAGRSQADGRRAHRDALVHRQRNRRADSRGQDSRRENE